MTKEQLYALRAAVEASIHEGPKDVTDRKDFLDRKVEEWDSADFDWAIFADLMGVERYT